MTAMTVSVETVDWTNGMKKASCDVAWYQATLSRVPETARQIFREYSKIPEDEILEHIYKIRDKGWEILPYPCIGVFRFLDLPACLSPVYPEVLQRVKNGETFLDLGCCFGQDIRKLLYDGAPSENIIGVDKEVRFIDLGYDLFRDRETLKARFYTGDVFAEDFLSDFHGKIDIVFLGSFLHLFNFDQQIAIVTLVEKLLRKKKGSLVFGRHMATEEKGGIITTNALGWDLYHHSPETIQKLFDSAPQEKFIVSSKLMAYASESWDNGVNWQGGGVKQQYFSAKIDR